MSTRRFPMPKPVCIDFETEAIDKRPAYPPKPVGVSIKPWGKPAKYFAWGHPTGNNCTESDARRMLQALFNSTEDILCHNAKFDLDVAETHMGCKRIHWTRMHDTMFLLFLHNPHMKSFGLKPAAEELLKMPPTEQQDVFQWLVQNKVVSRSATKGWGAHICKAPGDLVGKYADGDVDRTVKLFKHLWYQISPMMGAYNRERELLFVLLDMERAGLPVDHKKLSDDVKFFQAYGQKIDKWIFKTIGKQVKIDSGDKLVEALIESDLIDLSRLGKTEKGAWKTDKESLANAITHPQLAGMLNYRASLGTCMSTFMVPWLQMADMSGGRIFCQWNQIKSFDQKAVGAVTGRLSSTPNFQNIPNEFKPLWHHEQKGLPKCPLKDLPKLPLMRSYIVAPEGCVLIDRDYSQQEPRILGHFEDGALKEAYNQNPWLDMHDTAAAELVRMGKIEDPKKDRKKVKNINLGLIYGMGVGLLAQKNNAGYEETKELKAAILELYPGLREMQKDMKQRAMNNMPIRTWGGRIYHCEPPKMVPDRWNPGEFRAQTFDYKMVNVLVQGSAADCTKEAVLRYNRKHPKGHRLLLTVHDELMALCPIGEQEKGMKALQDAMESIEFDVPMLSEGKASTTSWADMVDTDKKGKPCL